MSWAAGAACPVAPGSGGVDERYFVFPSHERVLDLLRVRNCFGNYGFSVLFFLDLFFLPVFCYLQHFDAFWNWKLPFQLYLQHFGVGTFHFPLCLQHFGAQILHVAWYFATRVHLRLIYGCFRVYFGLALGLA